MVALTNATEKIVFVASITFAIMDMYDPAIFGMLAAIYLAITKYDQPLAKT